MAHFVNAITINHQQMALLYYYNINSLNMKSLCPFLTLYRSQHLCNPQWPGGVSDDALRCSHLNPAPGLHLSAQVKPAKCQSLVWFTATRCPVNKQVGGFRIENKTVTGWLSTHTSTCIMPVILSYLSTLDIFRAGADVHGHRHDNLQPGLHSARPPLGHGCRPGQLHLLQAVELVLRPV